MKYLVIVIAFIFISCESDCFRKSGGVSSSRIELGQIKYLQIENRVEVELLNDGSSYAEIIGREAFIENLLIEEKAESLLVDLDQSCGIMNHPDQIPKLRLSLPALEHIYFASTAKLWTSDTLTRDSLNIECWNSAGDIKLNIDIEKFSLANHIGPSDITIKGKADLVYLFSGDIGYLFLQELNANGIYLTHDAFGEVHVSASHTLDASINSSGNMFYYQEPKFLELRQNGHGKVTKVTN